MAQWLKQSTAQTVVLGPFVDQTDGFTAETALTISQADIRLSKNGGAFAQTNNAAGATHMENGHYSVPLDTTDTNTLGRLKVAVNESGALPVWQEFHIVPANVWDSFFGADKLQVHADEITANLITAAAIADGAIDAATFAAGAINAAAIAADAITDAKVAADVTIASVTGAVGSVTGAVGSVTGNVGGNVVGSVGSVTASVTVGTNNDKTGYSLAADQAVNVTKISGSATAADNLEVGGLGLVVSTCATGSTTTVIETNLTEATNDHYNGRVITFTSGALAGQSSSISDYNGTTKQLTVVALTEAPANTDQFVIS